MAKSEAIYAPDLESQRKYQEALDRVMASLDARKNRLFEPTLLALAEGFLSPTRTGSFGESLGLAAGKLRGAEEAKFKEEQELAQAQLGLAQQGMQLERQKQLAKAYEDAMRPPGSASLEGAPSVSAPASDAVPAGGTPPRAMPASAGPQGFEIAPGRPMPMSREQYLRIAQLEGTPLSKAVKEWDELERKNLETKEGGVFSTTTGKFFPFPKADQVNIQLRGYQGTFPVSTEDAMRLSALERAGDSAGYKALADRIVKGPSGTSRVSSAEEIEQERKRGTILAEEEAKTEAAQRNDIISRADQAGQKIRVANQVLALAEDPASARMFGILNNPAFSSAIAKLVETGIGIPGFSIGIPEIQNVLRNMKLRPEEIARFQYGAMLFAQSQLEASQLAKGQGAISDFERRLFAATAMTAEDTPGTLKMKSQALIARGQFDRQVARLWEKSKGQFRSVTEFKQSDEYDKLVAEYDAKLGKLLERMPMSGQPAAPGQPAKPPIRFQIERP